MFKEFLIIFLYLLMLVNMIGILINLIEEKLRNRKLNKLMKDTLNKLNNIDIEQQTINNKD